jgi:hypothetical protein
MGSSCDPIGGRACGSPDLQIPPFEGRPNGLFGRSRERGSHCRARRRSLSSRGFPVSKESGSRQGRFPLFGTGCRLRSFFVLIGRISPTPGVHRRGSYGSFGSATITDRIAPIRDSHSSAKLRDRRHERREEGMHLLAAFSRVTVLFDVLEWPEHPLGAPRTVELELGRSGLVGVIDPVAAPAFGPLIRETTAFLAHQHVHRRS